MSTAPRADHLSTTTSKASQRDRLIAAMTEVCARNGYRDATIAEAIAIAGVSRATFYEYFAHKRDCVLEAQRTNSEELTNQLQAEASRGSSPAPRTLLAVLLGYATQHPAATQLLVNEALAAGDTVASTYDTLLETLGATFTSTDPKAIRYLLAPDVLLGGLLRMLQPRLRAGETAVERFHDDVAAWLSRYELDPASAAPPPTVLTHTPPPRFLPEPPLLPPKPLSPGRRVLPQGEVNRNRRERILYATTQALADRGYLEISLTHFSPQRVFRRWQNTRWKFSRREKEQPVFLTLEHEALPVLRRSK